MVCVFIPEYVVGHWWEHLLHNQSALRLKARLPFRPGVMVTSVPWQLGSAEAAVARETRGTPLRGQARWTAKMGHEGRRAVNGQIAGSAQRQTGVDAG